MSEKGIVKGINGDEAVIIMTRNEACSKCGACLTVNPDSELMLYAKNDKNVKEGDVVSVEVNIEGFFSAVMIMYSIPLVALIAGLSAGYFIGGAIPAFEPYKEVAAFVAGIVLMLIAFAIIRKTESGRKDKIKYRPRIVDVVGREADGE